MAMGELFLGSGILKQLPQQVSKYGYTLSCLKAFPDSRTRYLYSKGNFGKRIGMETMMGKKDRKIIFYLSVSGWLLLNDAWILGENEVPLTFISSSEDINMKTVP